MKFAQLKTFLAAAVASGLLTVAASATPVTGMANIIANVSVSGTSVVFSPTFTTTQGASETGDFAGLQGGSIQSLSGGPVTADTSIVKFVTFSDGLIAPVYFDLTYIAPGVGTLAGCSSAGVGSACTPAGSPFSLFQLSSNTVLAALQLNGIVYTGSAATGSSTAVSVFTTQTVINGNIPGIVQMLQNGESLTGITYSATFAASAPAVPEPSTICLMGLGLFAAGLLSRRKR